MFECAAAGQRVVYRGRIPASSKRPARLRHVKAAVDVNGLPRDVRGRIAREERNDTRNFFDVTHPPERNSREHRLALFFRQRLSHVGGDDRTHRWR